MRDESSYLTISTDMKIKAVDPNVADNLGLFNQYKIKLLQLSGAICFVFNNRLKRTSYTSFQMNNNQIMYTDEVTDSSIECGIILFRISLDVIKPQIMIDNQAKERDLEDLTLKACQNNVCTYLTTMQEKKIEVDTIRKDRTTYNVQRMNTLIFDKLSKIVCETFLADVKRQKSKWIKDPVSFNTVQGMADLTNLYTNYKSTGLCKAQRKDIKSTILALATALKKYWAKNSAYKNPPGTTSGKPKGLAKWRFDHTAKNHTDSEGNQFVWCKKHVQKYENRIQSGMYMPGPHDHEKCQRRKSAGNAAWKENQNTRTVAKRKAPDSETATSDKGEKKLSLLKSFKTALSNQVKL